jgi:hypothetical protein
MPALGFVCVSERRSITEGHTIGVFTDELRTHIATIVGVEPPSPEGDAISFFRQWLGERNLGLVPIADPATFSWAGYWIARSGERAVLMYGSPSGPVDAPLEGAIDEGWIVAPLDLALPIDHPYGLSAGAGSVAGLLIAPDAEAPLRRVEEVEAIAGSGLAGDRYADDRGTFGGARGYQLTLVAAEQLDAVGLSWEDARRNVVTTGVDVNALVGTSFMLGDVECIGRRLAEPCSHLERVVGRTGLLRPLVHRAGLRADIISGGTVRVGDSVRALNS